MKKIVSSLLITVGSLGILAGIAGAVYAFSRNGSKLKDWITGDETSQTTSSKTSSSSENSSEAPTSSSSSEQSSSSSELPTEVPYNDPSKPLGVTVNIEPFEYYHEDGVSPVIVPIDVFTTGWEDGGESTLTYEIVGISGQAVVGVSLTKQGSNDALTGYTGDLPGGGHYTLTMNQAGYDEFYIYQFKVTAALGADEHVAQAKFCSNGAVSNSPYQGNYESSGINLVQRDGTQTRNSVQVDNDTANTATYYVVSSHADSTKRIKVHVDPWEEGDTVLLETDEFGSDASELIVPAGTEIRFKFPKKNQGEADRYNVSLNFVGEADVWNKTVANYGTTVSDGYLIHPEGNIEYDPQVDGADFRVKPISKLRDDDGSILKSAKVEFDNTIKDVMAASIQQHDRSNSITTSSYLRYASIDYVVSDQWINIHLGPIDPGVSGTVTVRALGMTWSFTYYREAPKALLWFNPESVILTNGNATTKTFHVYFPEGQRDAGLCQMSLRNPTTNGSTISDIVLQGTSSNGEMVNVTHGGTVSIAYPSFIEGGYKKYTLNFYYNGVLVNTVDCLAGRTTANANWETILNVYDQTITSSNGYFDHDIGIYFLKSTVGKTAWLEIYIDNAEVQFQLTSDDFSAYNSVGNTWQNQVTPVPGSIGNVHVRAMGTLEQGSYVIHFKHYYSDHPNLDGAFCTFNKTITLVVS